MISGSARNPLRFRDDRHTVVVIAGGPSAGQVEISRTRGWPTIVVNDAWRLRPDAAILYGCDRAWWAHHFRAVAFGFAGQGWTQDAFAAKSYGLRHIPGQWGDGLCTQPGLIHYGRNSGYQAINLAWHLGARRFVLVGFDCTPGPDGQRHWFGDHPGELQKDSPYDKFAQCFATLARDLRRQCCEVVNCSPLTALRCFPRGELADVLARD